MSEDQKEHLEEQLNTLPRAELLKIIFDTRDKVIVVENSLQSIREYIEKQKEYNSKIEELNNNLTHLNEALLFYDSAKAAVRTIRIFGNVIKWVSSVIGAALLIIGVSKLGE